MGKNSVVFDQMSHSVASDLILVYTFYSGIIVYYNGKYSIPVTNQKCSRINARHLLRRFGFEPHPGLFGIPGHVDLS